MIVTKNVMTYYNYDVLCTLILCYTKDFSCDFGTSTIFFILRKPHRLLNIAIVHVIMLLRLNIVIRNEANEVITFINED